MKNQKSHGGKRQGAGRPKTGKARVLITAKVLQETKQEIESTRGELSVGKFLDKIILKKMLLFMLMA